jgi:hypothetical protein
MLRRIQPEDVTEVVVSGIRYMDYRQESTIHEETYLGVIYPNASHVAHRAPQRAISCSQP